MEFNSLEDLYQRVLPALSIKSQENNGLITEKEIWDYLSKTKWINSIGLTLSEIVNDILKCNVSLIQNKK